MRRSGKFLAVLLAAFLLLSGTALAFGGSHSSFGGSHSSFGGGSKSSGSGGSKLSGGSSKPSGSGGSKYYSGRSKPTASRPSSGPKPLPKPITRYVPKTPPPTLTNPTTRPTYVPRGANYSSGYRPVTGGSRLIGGRRYYYSDPYGPIYFGFYNSPYQYLWIYAWLNGQHQYPPAPESSTKVDTALLSYLQIVKALQAETAGKS